MKVAILCLFAIASAGISVAYGSSCTQIPDLAAIATQQSRCHRVQANRVAQSILYPDTFVPTCNHDSTWTTKQYDAAKNESFCVNRATGEDLPNTRIQGENIDCSSEPGAAPNNYFLGDDGHHYRYGPVATYSEAEAACIADGARLAVIENQDSNDAIDALLAEHSITSGAWIGATDEEVEGTWKWNTGEVVSYFNWASAHPTNGSDEDCLMFKPAIGWKNKNCTLTKRYICQFDEGTLTGACDKAKAVLEEPGRNPYNLTLNCTDDGKFASLQSWQEFKWCSLANGALVPQTMKRNQDIECESHYALTDSVNSLCSSGDTNIPYPGVTCTSSTCDDNCNRYLMCGQGTVHTCACQEGLLFETSGPNAKQCVTRANHACPTLAP